MRLLHLVGARRQHPSTVGINDVTVLAQVLAHPRTQAHLSAVPIPDPRAERARTHGVLQGDVPSPQSPPSGCGFRRRGWKAQDVGAVEEPALVARGQGHPVACHFAAVTSVV